MIEIAPLIYSGAVAVALAYARTRGLLGLLVSTVFLIPWFGLMKDFGLTINADRIVAVFLVLALALRYRSRAFSVFTAFLAYSVAVTVALSVRLPASVGEYAPTKGEWRWLFQVPIWIMQVAPGAALALLGTTNAIRKALRALILSGTVLGAAGILQFIIFYSFGLNLFPLGLFENVDDRYAAFDTDSFMGGSVFRANALAGEPKHLAYTLVICLTIIVTDRVFGDLLAIGRRTFVAAVTICIIGLTLTFSTQGFALLAINAAVLVGGTALLRRTSRGLLMLAVSAPLLLALVFGVPGLSGVLYQRTVGRVMDTGAVEDSNEAVWAWYRMNPFAWPFGVGLGNVHLYAAPYIPEEYLYYMRGNVFVAKSGGLRILSELGIVGFVVFAATAIYPLRRLLRAAWRGSSLSASAAVCMVAGVIDYVLSNDGPTYVFFLIGLAAAAARVVAGKPVRQGLNATSARVLSAS